jgi:hypothetical protein
MLDDDQKTDAELCEHYPNLEPEMTRGFEKARAVTAQFEAEYFKPLIQKLSDSMTEHLWNLLRDHLLSDTEYNLEAHMRDRIEKSVRALLGDEQWAVDKYIMDKYDNGKKIRKALAELIPSQIMDARIVDMAQEISKLKEDIKREREWNRR